MNIIVHLSCFMNFYLLAASAWGVKKGNYPKKRFKGMIKNFEGKLEDGYKKAMALNLNLEDRISLNKGYLLYKQGLEELKTEDPPGLLKGLSSIDDGFELLSGYSCYFNKYILMNSRK